MRGDSTLRRQEQHSVSRVYGVLLEGRLQPLLSEAAKLRIENPHSHWLAELQSRVGSDQGNWTVKVGVSANQELERGGSESVYKLHPNLRLTFEIRMQGLL